VPRPGLNSAGFSNAFSSNMADCVRARTFVFGNRGLARRAFGDGVLARGLAEHVGRYGRGVADHFVTAPIEPCGGTDQQRRHDRDERQTGRSCPLFRMRDDFVEDVNQYPLQLTRCSPGCSWVRRITQRTRNLIRKKGRYFPARQMPVYFDFCRVFGSTFSGAHICESD
jgi:hypothetical protein